MPRKAHAEEQIMTALRQAEAGKKVSDVCRELGVSQQAFYSWKLRYAGLGLSERRELRQLREENRKLKTLVADLTLDKHILQEVLSKRLEARSTSRTGEPNTAEPSVNRKACLWAYRNHALDQPVPEPARPANRVAHAHTGASGQSRSVRISAHCGAAAPPRMEGAHEEGLSVVSPRRLASANRQVRKTSRTRARSAVRGGAAESTLEYGFCKRPISRWPLVPPPDCHRSIHARVPVRLRGSLTNGRESSAAYETSGESAWRTGIHHHR